MSTDNQFFSIDILGSWIEVGMVLAVVLSGVFISLPVIYKKRQNSKNSSPINPSFRSSHSRIHEVLTESRVLLNSDRTSLVQFHNGGNFADGSSMKKMSSTHESCNIKVPEAINTRQNLQACAFINLLDIISEEDPTPQLTSDLQDCHFKRHLESSGTLLYSIMPVKDPRNILTQGFVMAEWCSWDSADEIDEEKAVVNMKESSRYIEGGLLHG